MSHVWGAMAETAENINVSIPKQSLVGMIERMKHVTVLLIPQLEQEQNARSATGDDLLKTFAC